VPIIQYDGCLGFISEFGEERKERFWRVRNIEKNEEIFSKKIVKSIF